MRNTFNTQYARRLREPLVDLNAAERVSREPEQEWAVRQHELQNALTEMPARNRETLLLVASGVSYIDTAERCGCEIGTVKSRVHRARKLLESRIGAEI
ncbi:RNA polymerase sigma factor (sigma-70 family) [Shinella sp. BE166]|uniref:sigma factor-like helix-turn-helix DNA-binding protein n=1 Tax=Shinella sp. BE166 TaxID=3373918 RepID=UPI003EC0140D